MIKAGAAINYGQMGQSACVQFPVKKFRNSTVLWLNLRWLLSQGVPVHDMRVRQQLERWLLDHFAVSTSGSSADADFEPEELFLNADRYGRTGGSKAGGSGRCGSIGEFNAKGVGATPLVSRDTDWYHSHGCLWFEEAIREIVYSEIASSQLRHGSVPVIALIDTGSNIEWSDGSRGERRAIMVRPNFIRLAHLERTIFFGSAGTDDSDQAHDARRVDSFTNASLSMLGASASVDGLIEKSITSNYEQIVSGRVIRFWLGPFMSSNATVFGPAVDFGSARFVPSWARQHGEQSGPGFGDEQKSLVATLFSLMRNLRLRGNPVARDLPHRLNFEAITKDIFEKTLQMIIPLSGTQDASDDALSELSELLIDLYEDQQIIRLYLDDDYRLMKASSVSMRANALKRMEGLLERRWDIPGDIKRCSRIALARLIAPRWGLSREAILEASKRLFDTTATIVERPAYLAPSIDKLITTYVAKARVIWPNKPAYIHIIRFYTDGLMWVADGYDLRSAARITWVEAPLLNGLIQSKAGPLPKELRATAEIISNGMLYGSIDISYDKAKQLIARV